MSALKYVCSIVFLFFLCVDVAFSQYVNILVKDTIDESTIFENDSKIINFEQVEGELHANLVLKTFYGFYYDGIYPTDNNLRLALIGDEIFSQYWLRSTAYENIGVDDGEAQEVYDFKTSVPKQHTLVMKDALASDGELWLPATNIREITIGKTSYMDEVVAYYREDGITYVVRYWLSKMPYTEEKAELVLVASNEKRSVFIDKYVQIEDRVYTCTTGRATIIRNVTSIDSFIEEAKISTDGTILAFGKPYLVRSPIEDIEEAIAIHNTTLRPPRDGRARFEEPLIYEKMRKALH